MAEDVLGAAEDGSVVFIVARGIFQRRNPRPTYACRPHAALGRHLNDEHVKGVAQDVAEDMRHDLVQDSAFGALAARALLATPPPPSPPSSRSSRLAEMEAQSGSSVLSGQALSGVPRKAPLERERERLLRQ